MQGGADRESEVGPVVMLVFLALLSSASALAQQAETGLPGQGGIPAGPAAALKAEVRRYLNDGQSILLAPIHWSREDWLQAAGVVATVAIISKEDPRIDAAVQRNRSATTDRVSRAVTPFGSTWAVGASAAALGGGLIFRDEHLRDIGRDAVEAEIFAAGIITPILKSTFGRTRPISGGDGDEYRPLSTGQSFPSGHATEAFAVASVFAARSSGWVVPVVAYTLASGVALARMNDRAHFASDVVTGAVIGTVIGRTIVQRHTKSSKRVSWNVVPVRAERSGVGLGLRFATGS